ncbi:MAG: hypothetical protein Q605_AUC00978G0004 [Actinomyces urogenitalis DORA_12]|uniref:Uncharacterized protein n=1 Tax=Actinomyces urogenitalis DORA_12 TaxID=1403939 RepID=W1VET5_9ACTO|nr:MAG: hypothetical protein Q605_AUC00978G0004 [Actinomyces urogenitalis DORA_12]
MEQGATTIPRVRKEPEEMAAAMSLGFHTTSARDSTSSFDQSVSRDRVSWPEGEMTRCVSTVVAASACSSRTP